MSLKKSSIRDVAALAGVSISTVSRILNNHEMAKRIQPEIRENVLRCAKELNYVPNANVKRVFTNEAGIIGLVVPSYLKMEMHVFEDGHLRRMISGIEAGLGEEDSRLLLIFNDDRFMARQEYTSLILSRNVDGLIVWGAQPDEEYWRKSVEAELPIVFAVTTPGEPSGFNYIINATRRAMCDALDRLVNRGHRSILYLKEYLPSFLIREQEAALSEYQKRHPEIAIETLVVPECDFKTFFKEHLENTDSETAVLTYNYTRAEEVFRVLAEAEIEVPGRVELIAGYSFESSRNWISTMVVDDYRIGREAVRGLFKLIRGEINGIQKEIPSTFFSGKTTC